MKKVLLFTFMLMGMNAYSQDKKVVINVNDTTIYNVVDVDAVFPGSEMVMYDSIFTKLDLDKIFPEKNIKGTVEVEFIVEKDGSLKYFKILQSLDPRCDNEIITILKNLPKWNPAILNNQIVRFRKTVKLELKKQSD